MSCMPEMTPIAYVIMLSMRCTGPLSCILPKIFCIFSTYLLPLNFSKSVFFFAPCGPSAASSTAFLAAFFAASSAVSAPASAAFCWAALDAPSNCRILVLCLPWSAAEAAPETWNEAAL